MQLYVQRESCRHVMSCGGLKYIALDWVNTPGGNGNGGYGVEKGLPSVGTPVG